jgi:hypothetical protein
MFTRQFLVFLGIGLAVVAIALGFVWMGTKGAHLDLQGKVLKVRTLATDEKSSIAVLDFRMTNQATKQQFVVNDAIVVVTTADGKQVEGETIARTDVNRVFDYYKMLGPKYNETLIIRDKVSGGQTMDRMVAATFPLSEADIEKRKAMTLRLHDVDGPTFELIETGKP